MIVLPIVGFLPREDTSQECPFQNENIVFFTLHHEMKNIDIVDGVIKM